MLVPIEKGLPTLSIQSIGKLKNFEEDTLIKLYYHTNDIVQQVLIEEICRLKGFKLIEIVTEDDPTPPPRYA